MMHMCKFLYHAAGRGYSEGQRGDNIMWTRNTSGYSAWQRHMVTGHEPSPQHAQALTVVDDKAYMLVLEDEHLEVHGLDLQTWHWRRLQQRPMPFSKSAKDTIATALVEVCGSTCPTCNGLSTATVICKPSLRCCSTALPCNVAKAVVHLSA